MLNRETILAELAADYDNRNAIEQIAWNHGLISNDRMPITTPIIKLIGSSREYIKFNRLHSERIPQIRGLPKPDPATWWTDEHKRMVADLFNSGMSVPRIAVKLSRTLKSVQYGLIKMRSEGWELRKSKCGRKAKAVINSA